MKRGVSGRDLNAFSAEDGGLPQAKYLLHHWTELGLTDVQLTNYSVLLSQAGSSPSIITDKVSGQCFLPNGKPCDARSRNPASEDQLSSFAAYSAVGRLEAEVVDVQYGSMKKPDPSQHNEQWHQKNCTIETRTGTFSVHGKLLG
ncbi:hypothetical protein SKAU_G00048270 [Synaphobranchus kaupii]|uniref:Uncharacterized protein n=1 Tax=Synaphobranchus kaupii TaxID=118154 RepID=A0A9Q1G3G6_SYNKA|nr:hypothetical protein SKAU_G00048270 [Synaphobranchus kaupii]